LLVPFAVERLHTSGRAVGYLITGLGIGYLCGSALSRRLLLRFPARTIVGTAYAAVGLCFLVMFTTASLPLAVAAATAAGLPGAAASVATTHHLQLSTPDGVRGRVSAAFHSSDAIAAVAGALAAPAAVSLGGLSGGLVILSAAVLAAALLVALMLPSHPSHPDP
jgi:predicted MFS family arabinose efflux permease